MGLDDGRPSDVMHGCCCRDAGSDADGGGVALQNESCWVELRTRDAREASASSALGICVAPCDSASDPMWSCGGDKETSPSAEACGCCSPSYTPRECSGKHKAPLIMVASSTMSTSVSLETMDESCCLRVPLGFVCRQEGYTFRHK